MQILPSKELSPFIRHYLFLNNNAPGIQHFRVFADGNTGWVFSLKSRLRLDAGYSSAPGYLPESFLYGQLNECRTLHACGKTSLVVVVFHPSGMNLLTGMPSAGLCDALIPAASIFGSAADSLYQQLWEANSTSHQCSLLNIFFQGLVTENILPGQMQVRCCLDYIYKNKGLVSIGQLLTQSDYTERQLERKFLELVGLGPKKFANIVKLHRFLKYLQPGSPAVSLTSLAYETGYSDQSHLIKQFKQITGLTPGAYSRLPNKPAVNFLVLH